MTSITRNLRHRGEQPLPNAFGRWLFNNNLTLKQAGALLGVSHTMVARAARGPIRPHLCGGMVGKIVEGIVTLEDLRP